MDLVKNNLWSQDDYQPPRPSSWEKGEFFFSWRSPRVFSPFTGAPERCLGPGWQKDVILIIQQRCWEPKSWTGMSILCMVGLDVLGGHEGNDGSGKDELPALRNKICSAKGCRTKSALPKDARGSSPPLVLMTPPISLFWGLLCELVTHWELKRAMNGLEKANQGGMRRRMSLRLLVLQPCDYSVIPLDLQSWKERHPPPIPLWWTTSPEGASPTPGGNKMQPLGIFKA